MAAGVGVAELVHHAAGVDADRDENRGEGMAQLVRSQVCRKRRSLEPLESSVGVLNGSLEH